MLKNGKSWFNTCFVRSDVNGRSFIFVHFFKIRKEKSYEKLYRQTNKNNFKRRSRNNVNRGFGNSNQRRKQ